MGVSKGQGFTEEPNVYIRSKTGYNATIVPIFNVNRVGDTTQDEVIAPSDSVINVIDCVGKV